MTPITICLVDDHRLFRKGLRALIEDFEGIEVLFEAENGDDLLKKLPENPCQVILMDLEMPPGLDGIETTLKLRATDPETRIIILSQHDDDNYISHLMEQGANGYLVKTVEPEELEEAIRTVVAHGYYFSEQVSRAMLKRLTDQKFIKPLFNESIELKEMEIRVLKQICNELTTAEIADRLNLSPRTIEGYRADLMQKIGARNVVGLVLFAVKQGLS